MKILLGYMFVDDITAATIVRVLKDTILCMNLKMSMCRAQCYDGASNRKKLLSRSKISSNVHYICTAMGIVKILLFQIH